MPPIPHKQSKKAQRRAAAAGVASKPAKSQSKNEAKPRVRVTQDALRWKPVTTKGVLGGLDDTGGMMMLEELDGVDVEWEEGIGGSKTAKFMASEEQANKLKEQGSGEEEAAYADEDEWVPIAEQGDEMDVDAQSANGEAEGSDVSEAEESEAEDAEEEDEFDESKLPGWKGLTFRTEIKEKIAELGFKQPTEIQKQAVPLGLAGRDVVGVAETGSGKTLAYSLPIIQHLLSKPAPRPGKKRDLASLILCPTRELALQVAANISLFLPAPVLNADGSKRPPRISVASVVGGLSMQKQKRLVERGCDVLVATPGRLWDLMQMDEELAAQIRAIKFLVIDEADRMIETGHFAELENIVGLTQRTPDQARNTNASADDPTFQKTQTVLDEVDAREDMQTFVFSATMSKDLQKNLKRKTAWKAGKGKGRKSTALEELVDKLDFRDEDPAVVDLSPEGGLVATLKESMIECLTTDKDLYLYYFLLRYPGRSLVFVGSIDGIRRLIPLFEVLQVPVFPLHSQLQQKQRLKNLDRFKSSKHGILIATDVAARGLDIPSVDHVIHFNLPRTADAYIHRSGRTARAQNPGFALQLCAPEEKGVQRALMKSLGREDDLPDLNIDLSFLPKMRERIRVARAIEKAQHHVKKDNHEKNWLRETAEAMDIDIDSDMLSDASVDPDTPYHVPKKGKGNNLGTRKTSGVALINLRNELKALLAEPLMARGVSAKYPTSGSRVIIDELLKSANHPMMLGASTVKAYDEVQDSKPMRAKVPVKKVHVKKQEGHRPRKWEKEEAKAERET